MPFGRLVEQVMTTEPYARARRVFWIVDNGSSHRGQRRGRPPPGRVAEPRARPPALPRQLAQPDRDLLLDHPAQGADPNDFTSLQAVVDRLDAFEHHYNQIAEPFEWNFTRHDLAALIARVADHEPRLRLAA